VHSDIGTISNDWLKARLRFSASAPYRFYQDGEKEIPAWSLQAELDPIPVEKAKLFFLERLPDSFLGWVDGFLLDGTVEGDVMIFAFAKKREPDTFLSLLGDLSLKQARLDYL